MKKYILFTDDEIDKLTKGEEVVCDLKGTFVSNSNHELIYQREKSFMNNRKAEMEKFKKENEK